MLTDRAVFPTAGATRPARTAFATKLLRALATGADSISQRISGTLTPVNSASFLRNTVMRAKFIALGLVAAAVTLAGAIAMPTLAGAAEPSIPDNSPSDSAPNLVRADGQHADRRSQRYRRRSSHRADPQRAHPATSRCLALAHNVNVTTNRQAVVLARLGQARREGPG